MSTPIPTQDPTEPTLPEDPDTNDIKEFDPTNFDDVVKFMDKLNDALYGVRPFKSKD